MQEQTNRQKGYSNLERGLFFREEAYTTIMFIMDYFGLNRSSWDYRILATDISER